jgi:hypothetical protein
MIAENVCGPLRIAGTGNFLKVIIRTLPILTLAGCGSSPTAGIADAQHRYLEAKAACDTEYSASLVQQADCRTHAANWFIRPYYRYGDLMTFAQEKRRDLAMRVDQHELSRRSYDRQIAATEREVAREEDRRNRLAHTETSYQSTPFTPVLATFARIFN